MGRRSTGGEYLFVKATCRLRPEDQSSLNFPNTLEKEEDITFGITLYEVDANEESLKKNEGKTPNWDKDRVDT